MLTKTLPIVFKLSHCDSLSLSFYKTTMMLCQKNSCVTFCVWGLAHGLKYLINMYNIIILRLYAFMNIDGLLASIKMEKE